MGEVDTEFPLKTLPETKNGGWRRFSLRRDSALGRRESSAGVSNDTGLRFQSVCVDVSDKRILWDVSGQASPGHVLAVMGPSGSGKTTLLNTLASYMTPSSGSITLNGQRINKRLKRKISYVLQADIFFANLTLKETLRYSALLRLPSELSFKEKLQKVDDIIESLSLQDCANTNIGDTLHRGLSGGEKKRANIGCELLTNPILLLLDEPTSGLDSSSALSLLETLKSLAKRENKIVLASIHQPSSQMYHMFDGLLLLAKGKVAYFGPAADAMSYFASVGLECTLHYNPADYMLELVTNANSRKVLIGEDPKQEEMPQKLPWWRRWLGRGGRERQLPQGDAEMAKQRALEVAEVSEVKNMELIEYTSSPRLARKHPAVSTTNRMLEVVPEEVESEAGSGAGSEADSGVGSELKNPRMKSGTASPPLSVEGKRFQDRKWPTPWHWQFLVLTFRTFRQSRHVMLSKLHIFQTLAIAFVSSLVWFQIEHTEDTIQDRYGLVFFAATYWGFNTLVLATATFPSERVVIAKERASGSYHLSAYYLAKTVSELPIMLILPSVYIIIVYWSAGLNSQVGYFFASWGVLILHCFVGQSFGLMLGATVMDAQKALVTAIVFMLTMMLLGGFYIQNLPSWVGWTQWLSFLAYTFEALVVLQFTADTLFTCNPEASSYAVCNSTLATNTTMIPGTDVREVLDVDLPLYANVAALVGFALLYRLLAYLSLRFLNRRR